MILVITNNHLRGKDYKKTVWQGYKFHGRYFCVIVLNILEVLFVHLFYFPNAAANTSQIFTHASLSPRRIALQSLP